MDMHRSATKADWELIVPASRTFVQRVAATTHGVLTPANCITTLGFGLVLYALTVLFNGQYILGLVLLVLGRLLDVADGLVASITKTKSPLGEFYDATVDKLSTLLTIGALFLMSITQWWLLAALIVPQIVITLIIFYKRQQRVKLHPTRAGKLSMALVWIAVAAMLVAAEGGALVSVQAITCLAVLCSALLGWYAAWQYTTERI